MERRTYLQFATGTVGGVAGLGSYLGRGVRAQQSGLETLTQQTKLSAADGDSEDRFGSAVGVSGDASTAIIGAYRDEDPNGPNAGSAYVFERAGGWSQQAKLSAADGDSDDYFGSSVAVSEDGSTAVVGAFYDEDPNGTKAGSAYVFERAGGWSQQTKLTAADGDSNDRFGASVGMSGDGSIAIVGAPDEENTSGVPSGAAYAFERSGGSWNQTEKLTADDSDEFDVLGSSVAVSTDGSTAIVGAREDKEPNRGRPGGAYVFERSAGSWNQTAKLTAADGDDGDFFGFAVGVSGDGSTVVVGAYKDEDPNGQQAGSAYVFEQSGGSWNQAAKLLPLDGESGDQFGYTVAVSEDGSTAVLSARADDNSNGSNVGSAYVFERAGGSWDEQTKLVASDGDSEDYGLSVGVSGDGSTAILGALAADEPNGSTAGSAYVFDLAGSGGLPTDDPSFQEVLGVIEAFNDGERYNGVDVGFQDVLTVIEAFNSG